MLSETGNETQSEAVASLLKLQETATGKADEGAVVRWRESERGEGLEVVHKHVSRPSLQRGSFSVPFRVPVLGPFCIPFTVLSLLWFLFLSTTYIGVRSHLLSRSWLRYVLSSS